MAKHSPSLALTLEPIRTDKIPLIDLRSTADFIAGHPLGATHIPLETLDFAWHELPPKGATLDLLVEQEQLVSVSNIFQSQQYAIRNIHAAETTNKSDWISDNKSQRLWRANPLLENYISLIKKSLPSFDQQKPLAFDIGCGSGRDSIFLALHGFKVLALDNNDYALERLKQFDQRWQTHIKTKKLDFQNQPEDFRQLLNEQKPQLIIQARYLHRPLLLDYKKLLAKGSIVAVHTFLEGAAKFGKPKNPNYLLKNEELERLYSEWHILLNEEHKLEDGRPLSLFLAQKP